MMGCAGVDTQDYYSTLSAGRVGCRKSEIAISEFAWEGRQRTWTASCRGHTYFCNKDSSDNLSVGPLGGVEGDDGSVSCREAAEPITAGGATPQRTASAN
jgi:hypothetical protein